MTKEKQIIEEMAKCCTYYHKDECCADATHICDCDLMCEMFGVFANLEKAGYRKQSENIRCKDCRYFREYSTEYLREVEKADGDCFIRCMNSDNEQYVACCRDDFCSFAKMKGGAE